MEKLYLRFTNDIHSESVSYLKTPSMKKAKKLSGLCAFSTCLVTDGDNVYNAGSGRIEEMTSSEVCEYVERFRPDYLSEDLSFSLFTGKYLESNCNGEGVIVKKDRIIF